MPILPTIRELESVRLTCPLGIRFWDRLTAGTVGDGLMVTAAPVSQPELTRPALLNRRNGFVFRNLPGLREFELGDDQTSPFAASPALEREFVIRMEDAWGRFLPLSFRAVAPHKGWFALPCDGSPPDGPEDSVPLFSSPGRPLGGGLAVVRADLWDVAADAPAAWALLEIAASTPTGTDVVRGLANEDGRILLAFSYPELAPASMSGSPSAGGARLHSQTWELAVSVFYSALVPEKGSPPDLCDILDQAAATLLDQEASPTVLLTRAQLLFGQELVLRSSADEKGRVLVRPA